MPAPPKAEITVDKYIIAIILLFLIVQLKLRMKKRNLLFFTFLSILIVVLPSLRMIRSWEFQFHFIIALALILTTIWLSRISFYQKLLFTVLLCLTYWKNFYLAGSTILTLYTAIKTKYKIKRLRNMVYKMYDNCGFRFVHNYHKLPSKPTIFVLNYCIDRTEHSLCLTIPREITVIAKSIFGKVLGHNIAVPKGKGNYDLVKEKVKENLSKGRDIIAYINAPSYYRYIGSMSSGMFSIAREIGATITPIAFDTIKLSRFLTIPKQNLCVKVGETFNPESIGMAKIRCRKFFKESLKEFDKNKYNFQYLIQ